MHKNEDITIDSITKIEGNAELRVKIGEDGKPVINKETQEQVYETVDFYTPLTNKSKNKISQLLKAKDIDLDKELDRADNEALGRTTPTQKNNSYKAPVKVKSR